VGNVGVALPPLGDGVLEEVQGGEGYIGYYDGGAFGIPHSSKNQEAAMLWLQYIGQESVQAEWAVAGARITHEATYDDPLVVEADTRCCVNKVRSSRAHHPIHSTARSARRSIRLFIKWMKRWFNSVTASKQLKR